MILSKLQYVILLSNLKQKWQLYISINININIKLISNDVYNVTKDSYFK